MNIFKAILLFLVAVVDIVSAGNSNECHNLGGLCVHKKRLCPDNLPLETYRGAPYCPTKKFRCCYPASTACPVVTCPTCPTPPSCPLASCPTCPPLTTIPFTDNILWHEIGEDKFAVPDTDLRMNWFEAQIFCERFSLKLYQPENILTVSQYLENNVDYQNYWIGSKGNGSHQVWVSSEQVLTEADPWYDEAWHFVGANDCVGMFTCCELPAKGTVLQSVTDSCTVWIALPLCG